MEYASILARGRDGNKGSQQWPDGIAPMMRVFDIKLERDLDAIRY